MAGFGINGVEELSGSATRVLVELQYVSGHKEVS
jgi:hypothetical protein